MVFQDRLNGMVKVIVEQVGGPYLLRNNARVLASLGTIGEILWHRRLGHTSQDKLRQLSISSHNDTDVKDCHIKALVHALRHNDTKAVIHALILFLTCKYFSVAFKLSKRKPDDHHQLIHILILGKKAKVKFYFC